MIGKHKENIYELPKNWVWTDINSIAELLRGVSYDKSESSKIPLKNYVPILRATNINQALDFDNLVYVPEKNVKDEQYIREMDIILAMSSGSKDLVGKAAQALENFNGSFGTFCGLIRPTNGVNKKFIGYFFQSSLYRERISELSAGVNINNLRRNHIEELPFPLAPLNEQNRIVSKLEELLTKFNAGIEYLKKIRILLKEYRQSVLNYAFEGKLTDKWREKNKNLVENTSILQKRIQNERSEGIKSDKIFKKDNQRNEFQQMKSLDQQERQNLPKSWKYVYIDEICHKIESGSTPLRSDASNFDPAGIPFIKVENITRDGRVVLKDDQLHISVKIHEKNFRSMVSPGDILMNIVGPPLGKIGLVTPEIREANINQAIVVMRPVSSYNPKILLYCLLSPLYYKLMVKISTGVRQSNIRKSHVGRILVPLMSFEEQKIIVDAIETEFSIIDNIQSSVILSIKKSSQLRESIFKNAFSGKLISQEPNDESAEILLERMKLENEKIDIKVNSMRIKNKSENK